MNDNNDEDKVVIVDPRDAKMKPIKTLKKEYIEYTDGFKYVFKITEVEKGKYRIGIAFRASPNIILAVLPRQFSPHIKRQFYRDRFYLGKVLKKIAADRNWSVWNE